jgi:acylphosphatase
MLETLSIIVTGKVQGVYYRQSTKRKATTIGIVGTVQNLPNGDVKIIATGEKQQLEGFIEWCKKGPTQAKVVQLTIEPILLQPFKGFEIIR